VLGIRRNNAVALGLALVIVATAAFALSTRHPVRRLTSATKVDVQYPQAPLLAIGAPASTHTRVARGTSVRPWSGPTPASANCPEMDNPGGIARVVYGGPDPTDGSVSIPALGVHAPLVRVGIDGGTGMVLPRNARDVAWLDQGTPPGATNNVALAGHISWGGVPGSFGRIESLRPGSVIQVDLHGHTWKYAVKFSCYLPYNSPRGAQVTGRTDVPSVTLVSCAGTWNAWAGTHNLRIIVRAEQIYPPLPPATHAASASGSGGGSSSSGSGGSKPQPTPTPAPGGGSVLPGVPPLQK
jgi:sortase (surface protein transpeptidase)